MKKDIFTEKLKRDIFELMSVLSIKEITLNPVLIKELKLLLIELG